jgi:hypothetical protein
MFEPAARASFSGPLFPRANFKITDFEISSPLYLLFLYQQV